MRGFKARSFKRNKGNDALDDDLVDYGERRSSQKKRISNKPRRGSDSNISAMSNFHDPTWFDSARKGSTNSKKGKKKKKGRHRPDISIDTDSSLLQPDLDGDVTPPPSPLDKGLRFDQMYGGGIPEDSEDDDYQIDSNSEHASEIDLDEQRVTNHTKLQDNTSGDGATRIKKTSSIDNNYAKSRGSKSTSKDIMISEDMDDLDDFGVNNNGDNDYDPDIDVGDYDWNSYSLKAGKAKLKTTHSDEDITTDTAQKLVSPKDPAVRPQSARVQGRPNAASKGVPFRKGTAEPNPHSFFPSNTNTTMAMATKPTRKSTDDPSNSNSSSPKKRKKTSDVDKDRDKEKEKKSKRKGTKDSDDGSNKGHKRKGSKGLSARKKKSKATRKNTGDKDKKSDKKSKPEKPNGIKVISEDKKLSVKGEKKKSKGSATPNTPSTPSFNGKRKRKGTTDYDKEDKKKKGKHKNRKSELPKRDGKKKTNKKRMSEMTKSALTRQKSPKPKSYASTPKPGSKTPGS